MQQEGFHFLALPKGDIFASADLEKQFLSRPDFKSEADWQITLNAWKSMGEEELSDLPLAPRWNFDRLGLIPRQVSHENLRLIIGSQEAATREFANTIFPCGVFNLSITPSTEIENIHQRMQTKYHQNGGKWLRSNVPRTVLVFIDATPGWSDEARREKATIRAKKSMQIYWQAMEETVDTTRIENAIKNALVGSLQDIIGQIKSRFHSEDRLMLWIDFFNHDNNEVKKSMTDFWEHVAPHFSSDSVL